MKIHLTCLFLFCVIYGHAQQDPLYAQYLLNPLIINPAHAGLNNNFNAVAGYRVQWSAFEGQPNTLSASAHSSLIDNRVGVGLSFMNDRVGIVTNTEVNAIASYKLLLDDYTVSFGMQAGLQQFSTSYRDLNIYDPTDIAFAEGQRESRMNIGAGLALKSENVMVGISVPRLLPTTFENGGQEFQLYQQHFYLTAAYLYHMSEDVWLKPSILARGVKGAPPSVDGSLNFILKGRHMAGLFTRSLNTYGVLLQALVNDRVYLGYIFEVPTNRSVGTRFTTHEINVGIRLSALSFHDNTMSHF